MWDELDSNIIDNKIVYYYKKDECIGQLYIKNGIWFDSDIINIIKKYRIQDKDILDIGAFIGTVSLRLYDLIKDEPNSKIHAFEPRYNKCLKKNIIENNMSDKIILHEYGLANNNGYIDDHLKNNPDIRNLGAQECIKLHNGINEIKIDQIIKNEKKENNDLELRKLDDLNLNNIGFIKIDVEAMEIEVIKGSINTLIKNNYPPLYIELLAYDTNCIDPTKILYNINSRKVVEILNNLGYKSTHEFIEGISTDYLFLYNKN
jgi:FkbM family methyltransferase